MEGKKREDREKGRRKTRGERLRVRSVKNASWVLVCLYPQRTQRYFHGCTMDGGARGVFERFDEQVAR